MIISQEKFIEIWQTSSSIGEVCRESGLTYNSARVKSDRLRRSGIPLKKLRKRKSISELIDLAKSFDQSTERVTE